MFLWLLCKREAFMTLDLNRYNEAKDKLAASGIAFRTRWRSARPSGSRERNSYTFGEHWAYTVQYYIYVRNQDLEKARSVLDIS